MSANRLFILSMVIAVVAVVGFVARANVSPSIVDEGANRPFIQTNEESFRESQLGERYGELPGYIDGFSPEQIQREYVLGERYGVTPQQHAHDKALHEYWLGERYGQTPSTLVTP